MRFPKPQYINKFQKLSTEVKLNSGEPVVVYTISQTLTDEEKNEWAKHILHHYISDGDIDAGAKIHNLSKAEYIKSFVLPSIELRNGSEVSGVFGEIVFSDFIEYILDYVVPRYKLFNAYPGNPNQGIDIVAYKLNRENHDKDVVLFAEIKARLGCKDFHKLQEAINDAEHRSDRQCAIALDSARRRLKSMGNLDEAQNIARFADSEKPCIRMKSAGVITSAISCTSDDFASHDNFIGVNINSGEKIETHVIFANDLMNLAKDLWERACL